MNKKILAVSIVLSALAFYLVDWKGNNTVDDSIVMDNVEALADDVENIDGTWYVKEKIPCASASQPVESGGTYVNCLTCKSENGHPVGLEGQCTNIRPF